MIDKFFKTFDIYGSPFNLRINGQNKFKSSPGGFLSMITLLVMLMTIIYFGKNFYKRQNPKITIEEGLYLNSEIPILEGDSYEEKIVILQYSQSLESQIKPYVAKFSSEDGSITHSYPQDCSKEYLFNNSIIIDSKDPKLEFFSFKCLKLNDFKIGGLPDGNSQIPPLIVNWERCLDIPEDIILANNLSSCDKSLNETISFIKLTVWYQKIGFSPNSQFPFNKKYFPTAHIPTSDKNSLIYFPISLYHLNDDLGWIFNSTYYSYSLNFLNFNLIQLPQVFQSDFPQVSLIIYVSDDYKVFTRNYEKIQDLLAVIGGFMKVVFAILNLMNLLIRAYLIDNYMIEKLFDQGDFLNSSYYKRNPRVEKNINVNKFILENRNLSKQDRSINSKLFFSSTHSSGNYFFNINF
jgi:hypothetical protein